MRKMQFAKEPSGFFLKVKCDGCGNEQTIFSCATRALKCLGCDQVLAEPGSGKISLRSRPTETF